MESALYIGWVRHRRFADVAHAFRQRLCMAWIDLAELGPAFRVHPWWRRGPAPVRFHRPDYLGDPAVPLDTAVRDAVQARTGVRPAGPVRMLTQLRTWGLCFNPVTFYYCYDPAGREVQAVAAEITSTPWLERHLYVVQRGPGGLAARFAKAFHISPFQGMDLEYAWRLGDPGRLLGVHMTSRRAGRRTFDATLVLVRRPWTAAWLARPWFRHPAMTMAGLIGIYWQALRLWRRRAPFVPHPAAAKGRP